MISISLGEARKANSNAKRRAPSFISHQLSVCEGTYQPGRLGWLGKANQRACRHLRRRRRLLAMSACMYTLSTSLRRLLVVLSISVATLMRVCVCVCVYLNAEARIGRIL